LQTALSCIRSSTALNLQRSGTSGLTLTSLLFPSGLPLQARAATWLAMDWAIPTLQSLALGYFCGSIPFGYFAGKLRGIDIREHGSKNIGATNVIRVCGKGIGIPVFLLDVLKGWFPAWFTQQQLIHGGASAMMVSTLGILAGVAAVLGHNYTCWLKGRGGKGVASSLGMLLGCTPVAGLIGFGSWALVTFTTKYVSLGSIVAAIVVPSSLAIMMARSEEWNPVLLGFVTLLGIVMVWRHRPNIQRLLAGTESKIGQKKKSA
jgi:acyl phosphate:glycerol-3-phosphate acyltransferase